MRSLEVHTSPKQIDSLLDRRGLEASSADSLWGGMDHSTERHLQSPIGQSTYRTEFKKAAYTSAIEAYLSELSKNRKKL